jgi:hypothetical protein
VGVVLTFIRKIGLLHLLTFFVMFPEDLIFQKAKQKNGLNHKNRTPIYADLADKDR